MERTQKRNRKRKRKEVEKKNPVEYIQNREYTEETKLKEKKSITKIQHRKMDMIYNENLKFQTFGLEKLKKQRTLDRKMYTNRNPRAKLHMENTQSTVGIKKQE